MDKEKDLKKTENCEGSKGYCETQKKFEETVDERDKKGDALSVEEQAKVKTGEDDVCLGKGIYGEEVNGEKKNCCKDNKCEDK